MCGLSISGKKSALVDHFKVAIELLVSLDNTNSNESLEENEDSWTFMQGSHVLKCSFDLSVFFTTLLRKT